MDQTRALAALAPFLALAKSATSPRAAADLVTQATSANGTYVFAELLAQPNIAALRSDPKYGAHHALLEVFAWGTWETYTAAPDLPALSDAQTLKLRLLSLLSYAAERPGDLGYAPLARRLGLAPAAPLDLEHLVTTAIYHDLAAATLDPAQQIVRIASVAPLRDLAPGSVGAMLADMAAWSGRCDAVLADLEAEIASVKRDAATRAARAAKAEKQVRAAVEAGDKSSAGNGAGAGAGGSGASNALSAGGRTARTPGKRETADDDFEDDSDAMELDGQGSGGKKRMSGFMGKFKGK